MSRLPDALRRAGAASGDHTAEPVSGGSLVDNRVGARDGADEFDLDPDVVSAAPASQASRPAVAAGQNPAAHAAAVLRGCASGSSVIRTTAVLALGAVSLLGGLILGGWYYYESTRGAVDRELARYTPDVAAVNDRSAKPDTAADAVDPSAAAVLDPATRVALGSTAAEPARADTSGSVASGRDPADATVDSVPAAATPAPTDSGDGGDESAAGAAEPGGTTGQLTGGAASNVRGTASPGTASADAAASSGSGTADAAAVRGPEDSPEPAPNGTASAVTGHRAADDAIRAEADTSHGSMVHRTDSGGGRSPLARALQDGYRALRSGDLTAARQQYRRAVELDPSNRDARLGAAVVARRQGDTAVAIAHYRRVLADHPRDPYARSGLAGLQGSADPRQLESELKTLLKQDPNAHALRFALGNLYARENRWSQAQSAYFEAFRAAPGAADYAFNLAVALDRLGRRQSAVAHYGAALELAGDGPASFAPASARRRLGDLR